MTRTLVLSICLIASLAIMVEAKEYSGPGITVSGNNQVNGSYGDIMYSSDKPVEGTGDYLTDYLDFDIGIKSFFVRGTFLVNSPSVGYNPFPEVVNEFFHRRTVGFKSEYMTVEGGNFKTAFGRGLTLNLRENRKTEKNYILDGVCLTSDLPWFSVQAIVGRSVEDKKTFVAIPINEFGDSITTLLSNINYRDNILGAFAESFYPFSEIPALSFLSASSWGGGVVCYRSQVEKPRDTSQLVNNEYEYYLFHNRNLTVLPSWFINLSMDNIDIGYENALMFHRKHRFVDTTFTDEVVKKDYAYAGYLSLGVSLANFYLSCEYKNYFYARNLPPSPTGYSTIANWVEAPDARQKHGWHLLTKHTISKTMYDDLGYNMSLNWSGDKTTLLTNFSIGGNHVMKDDSTKYSFVKLAEDHRYWESYSQWEQNFSELFNIRSGFSIGVIDNVYEPNRLDRTLGLKLLFGPFADKHSVELTVEGQYATEEFEFKTDSTEDVISQDLFNLFFKPSYSLSPFLNLFLAGEIEPEFYKNYADAKVGGDTDINYYLSGGLKFTPVPNHVISIEAGSMSGRMECNPPPCVYIQPFKGVKVTLNSIF